MADVTGTYYDGDAFIGYGAEVLVGQGAPVAPETEELFVSIPDVESITFGDMTTGVVDTTHLRSTGRHRERKATIRDSGPISLVVNYRPDHGAHMQTGGDGFTDTNNLLALWRNVTEANFKLILPDDAALPVTPPATPDLIELPIRGVITKYTIGQLTLDGKTTCAIDITPLHDFSGDLP
jgi:hypothetical protein